MSVAVLRGSELYHRKETNGGFDIMRVDHISNGTESERNQCLSDEHVRSVSRATHLETDSGEQQKHEEVSEMNGEELKDFVNEDDLSVEQHGDSKPGQYKTELIWLNLISITALHLLAVYASCTLIFEIKYQTYLWGISVGGIGGFGVTAGVHRLWTHRAYSAKWPLRLILALCFSVAGQNTIFDWVRDHRVHHKFSETDADPHNAGRGFFFAHVGWLMQKKHAQVLHKGRQIDMSDVVNDPVVKFHAKYFTLLKLLFCFAIPICVPHYAWDEPWYRAIMAIGIVRYVLSLNFTWMVNSAAHIWGSKPFDSRIGPAENLAVSILAIGEGWHNYHHVFPWDYKAAELGNYSVNVTTFWIDLFSRIGWAYDLKQPSADLVRRVAESHGDGSHDVYGHHGKHVEIPDPVYTPMECVNQVFKYYGIQHKLN